MKLFLVVCSYGWTQLCVFLLARAEFITKYTSIIQEKIHRRTEFRSVEAYQRPSLSEKFFLFKKRAPLRLQPFSLGRIVVVIVSCGVFLLTLAEFIIKYTSIIQVKIYWRSEFPGVEAYQRPSLSKSFSSLKKRAPLSLGLIVSSLISVLALLQKTKSMKTPYQLWCFDKRCQGTLK